MSVPSELSSLWDRLRAAGTPAGREQFERVNLTSWSETFEHSGALVFAPSPEWDEAGRPVHGHQIAEAMNWAKDNGYRVRPIARHERARRAVPLHNWSPLHVPALPTAGTTVPIEPADDKVLYVSMQHLGGVRAVDEKTVTVLPGTRIYDLMAFLHDTHAWMRRDDDRGATDRGWMWKAGGAVPHVKRTIPSIPAPGVLSVGGLIAIGGHGSRLSSSDQVSWPGSISACVEAMTVVCWDPGANAYAPTVLTPADPRFRAAQVHLGRIVVIDVTLRTHETYNMTVSFMEVERAHVYGADAGHPHSVARLATESAGIETLTFRPPPGEAESPKSFVLVWRNAGGPVVPWGGGYPLDALMEVSPFNRSLANVLDWKGTAKIALTVGRNALKKFADQKLDEQVGAAGAQRIYTASDLVPAEPFSWAVLVRRDEVQTVVNLFEQQAMATVDRPDRPYSKHHLVMEVRITDVDSVGLPEGTRPPLLSVPAPVAGDADTVVWLTIFSSQTKPSREVAAGYFADLEGWLVATCAARGWTLRPEWSKTWGFTPERGPYSMPAADLQAILRRGWGASYDEAAAQFHAMDPHRVCTTPFHDVLGL